jgi:hypothetical protein
MAEGEPGQQAAYSSARDLPSVAEMLKQIQGMKLLTRLVARKQRAELVKLEAQVLELTETVDRFYSLLGARHWIFHDDLNTEEVKALVLLDPEAAERAFIEIYRDPEALRFMIRRLNGLPAMRARMDLIEKARIDYQEGRFYATVLVLITVMDGFVNDLEPARRRGLHTREADELAAWDSVVGHHMGLTNAHKTFTKSTYKTSDEPLYELQRHGIIHGTLLNYDNVVVATKAWNRLFAVADWARSIAKKNRPTEPEPSWGDLLRQISRNERNKKALAEWQPKKIAADDPAFHDEEVCARAKAYLDAWKRKNYGAMAPLITPMLAEATPNATAGMVRAEFESWNLENYTLRLANFEAAAVCEIDVDLVIDADVRPARMRWIREDADGKPSMSNENGTWYLYLWGPWAMVSRREAAQADD